MSLTFGYDIYKQRINKKVLRLAKELTQAKLACAKNDKMHDETIAKALSKANSASYKSRKVGEVANEALALAKSNNIKTFTTTMLFNQYGKPAVVKSFKTGIVLLGIETKAIEGSAGKAYYDFYDITGSDHIAEIKSQHGNYNVINKDSVDSVLNIQNVYTCPMRCTIVINLLGKDKTSKPTKPVKLGITVQYIELGLKDSNNSLITK